MQESLEDSREENEDGDLLIDLPEVAPVYLARSLDLGERLRSDWTPLRFFIVRPGTVSQPLSVCRRCRVTVEPQKIIILISFKY